METKNLRLTFRYKSDGCVKFPDPRIDDVEYRQVYPLWSMFGPRTEEEKKKEKWLPYRKNPHILISNYGGIMAPGYKKPLYPQPRLKDGLLSVGFFKKEAWHKNHPTAWVAFRLPLEVCRLFVPIPKGRTLYSRKLRDGNPRNVRAENMTFYTGYRNTLKTNPYYNYDSVLNMIEKRKEMVDDLRSRGIDPFDGW